MNRIVLKADNMESIYDDSIKKIDDNTYEIINNTRIELYITKDLVDLTFNIKDNVILDLVILSNNEGKIKYTYNLDSNSRVNITKLNDCHDIKELTIFNLNGTKSEVNYIFKTISLKEEREEVIVNHNAPKTNSNIINHGVNVDNNLVFTVSSFIPKGIKGCNANQINRIVNLTENKCIINPNLFIDEEDVNANHSAYLGKFSDEEMFYIESRGIDSKTALNLLIKGFLLSKIEDSMIKEEIENKINIFGGEKNES